MGLSEPMQRPIVYPFLVTALKTTKLMTISSADLRDVLATFHGADADSLCECLRADHKMSIETLKPRRGRAAPMAVASEAAAAAAGPKGADSRVNGGDTSAAGAELELAELGLGKLGAFEEQLGSCFSTLESLQAQTSTLPAMKSLLADLVKASAKNGDVSC